MLVSTDIVDIASDLFAYRTLVKAEINSVRPQKDVQSISVILLTLLDGHGKNSCYV